MLKPFPFSGPETALYATLLIIGTSGAFGLGLCFGGLLQAAQGLFS